MTETAAPKLVNRPATARPAAAVRFQRSALRVSSPRDPAEREAEATARRVTRMPVAAPVAGRPGLPGVQRSVQRSAQPVVQRKAEGVPDAGANVAAEIQGAGGSGAPLPLSVRRFMEPRFRADFGNVRIHTGDRAATLNRQLAARAFTVGNQIFFGRDQYRPETGEGRELIAHELTHTIQQGSVVQRAEDITVTTQSPVQVQRLGISDALDYFADKANYIPGFRMFTILLGVNPINMSRVDRSAANILRAVIEFIPGGALIVQALDNYGIFDRIGNWVEQQLRTLGIGWRMIRDAIDRFLDSLSWRDIFRLGSVWDRAVRIFTDPIDRIITFARNLAVTILRFIKDAILRPLAGLAQNTRGYDLLKAILRQDPITGDPYPQNADTLIGGFMKLIGQEEVYDNIKKANALARAWAWFQGALSGLLAFVTSIPRRFVQTLMSLTITDIVVLPRAFAKVAGFFVETGVRFVSWGVQQVLQLLQIIFEVVAPGAMVYLRRAAGAFQTIIRNPIGFIRNLVRAGVLGFRQFSQRFLVHLRAALIGWLTGALSGANIYIPQAFTLREIIKFVLSVLGLTWQNIRGKIVRVIGEPAMAALETGFDIVLALIREGPAAAWEKIQEAISNLRELVMEQVMSFVNERIVQAAITRLLTSLNPAGAFIQAVLAIYNTIMFFVERLRQIAQVARSVIDAIAAIASGVIAPAANRVEQTMAGLLVLVISFLARLVGLGNVGQAVAGIVARIRAPIDRALDRVVEWIVTQARRLGRLVAGGVRRLFAPPEKQFEAGGERHRIWFRREGEQVIPMISSNPDLLGNFLRLANANAAVPASAKEQIPRAQLLVERMRWMAGDLENPRVADDRKGEIQRELQVHEQIVAEIIQTLLRNVPISAFNEKYSLEGLVATYAAMQNYQRYDDMTPDHQPQAGLLIHIRTLEVAGVTPATPLFPPGYIIHSVAASRAAGGMCINLHANRHRPGRTYLGAGRTTLAAARTTIQNRIAAFPGDRDRQRAEVAAVLRAELAADAATIRSVVAQPNTAAVWADITGVAGMSDADKATLINRIRQQVTSGEVRIEAQNVDRLVR